jgi:hypothetical protein
VGSATVPGVRSARRASTRATGAALLLALLAGGTATGVASGAEPADRDAAVEGAPGIGDPYFPLDGNGGYDAQHYLLDLRYDPASDQLQGVATIRASSTASTPGCSRTARLKGRCSPTR